MGCNGECLKIMCQDCSAARNRVIFNSVPACWVLDHSGESGTKLMHKSVLAVPFLCSVLVSS